MDPADAASQDTAPYVDDPAIGHSTLLWSAIWLILFCIFVTLPFCSNAKTRDLCRRRIRERRWIQDDDDDDDDWYAQAVLRRREERRQQMEARNQEAKTQEDKIREQDLLMLLAKNSVILARSDIQRSSASNKLGQNAGKGGSVMSDDETDKTTPRSPESSNHHVSEDIESPTLPRLRKSSAASDGYDEVVLDSLDKGFHDETNEVIYVPLPGEKGPPERGNDQVGARRRQVPNGCAVCLSLFLPDEKISWSSNPDCSHVFHHDCLLHWFHEVGRKTQKRHLLLRPDMSEAEALGLLCKFPKLCPCCRQTFCAEVPEEGENKGVVEEYSGAGARVDLPLQRTSPVAGGREVVTSGGTGDLDSTSAGGRS